MTAPVTLSDVMPVRVAQGALFVALLRESAAYRSSCRTPSAGWLGVFDAVLGNRTPEELGVLCDVLRPLDGQDLLPTLTEFLAKNGHLENAAAALGVHRQTMRKRLGRIAELLSCGLDSADTRAQLLLAVRAREILGGLTQRTR